MGGVEHAATVLNRKANAMARYILLLWDVRCTAALAILATASQMSTEFGLESVVAQASVDLGIGDITTFGIFPHDISTAIVTPVLCIGLSLLTGMGRSRWIGRSRYRARLARVANGLIDFA